MSDHCRGNTAAVVGGAGLAGGRHSGLVGGRTNGRVLMPLAVLQPHSRLALLFGRTE
ncbi:MAG: hypothetical protein AAB360_01595 [Patescibacteria group bacterium]